MGMVFIGDKRKKISRGIQKSSEQRENDADWTCTGVSLREMGIAGENSGVSGSRGRYLLS